MKRTITIALVLVVAAAVAWMVKPRPAVEVELTPTPTTSPTTVTKQTPSAEARCAAAVEARRPKDVEEAKRLDKDFNTSNVTTAYRHHYSSNQQRCFIEVHIRSNSPTPDYPDLLSHFWILTDDAGKDIATCWTFENPSGPTYLSDICTVGGNEATFTQYQGLRDSSLNAP